jgi:hypothetical protein
VVHAAAEREAAVWFEDAPQALPADAGMPRDAAADARLQRAEWAQQRDLYVIGGARTRAGDNPVTVARAFVERYDGTIRMFEMIKLRRERERALAPVLAVQAAVEGRLGQGEPHPHDETCPICCELISSTEEEDGTPLGAPVILCAPGACHAFHSNCIKRFWDTRARDSGAPPSCPSCRGVPTAAEVADVCAKVCALEAREANVTRLAADATRQDRWEAFSPPASRDADLDAVQPPGAAVPGEWHVIDQYSVLTCIVSPCGHLADVPQALRADWARATTEVLDYIESAQQASDAVALERGLKWRMVLHDVLLRGPRRGTRGSGRAAGHLEACFSAWRRGDRTSLLRWWEADRGRAWGRSHLPRRYEGTEARPAVDIESVLDLVADGEISRAAGRLHSFGVASITEDVLRQLARTLRVI